jgi:hypothetical protein
MHGLAAANPPFDCVVNHRVTGGTAEAAKRISNISCNGSPKPGSAASAPFRFAPVQGAAANDLSGAVPEEGEGRAPHPPDPAQ